MSRAADLFDRLKTSKNIALEQLIADRELESLFLDFKGSPSDGAAPRLADDDNRNLSKAISGFGNSSGGVVIWGVDCRRDPQSGNEVAKRKPLVDAAGFSSKLQGAISRVTVPPHPGVQVEFFEDHQSTPAGYVAVLIPQSTIGPIRSVTTNHYHVRSGADFGIVSHDVLAGMFGKAPQPFVDVNLVSYPARLDSRPGHFTVAFGIVAVNLGAVMCERPYLSIAYGDLPSSQIIVRDPDTADFSLRKGPLPVIGVVARADLVLPPGGVEHICDVVIEMPISLPMGFRLECTLGVVGAPPRRFLLETTADAMAAGVARANQGLGQSTDIVQLIPQD